MQEEDPHPRRPLRLRLSRAQVRPRIRGAYEGSPNAEPTARKIIALKKKMDENGIRYVYFEEPDQSKVSELLARETGATLLYLHPGPQPDEGRVREGCDVHLSWRTTSRISGKVLNADDARGDDGEPVLPVQRRRDARRYHLHPRKGNFWGSSGRTAPARPPLSACCSA